MEIKKAYCLFVWLDGNVFKLDKLRNTNHFYAKASLCDDIYKCNDMYYLCNNRKKLEKLRKDFIDNRIKELEADLFILKNLK